MATVEIVQSQEMNQTTEGVTLNRVFTSTWDDYNTGSNLPSGFGGAYDTSNPFPYRVGDPLAYDSQAFPIITDRTLNLRITNIRTTAVDNVNIIAEIFYSTVFERVSERAEPDTNASWEEQFDMSSVFTTDDIYYNDSANASLPYGRRAALGGEENWINDWDAAGKDEAKRPPHELYNPNWVWTVRAYSSTLFYNRILTFFLSVNSNRWLEDYFSGIANRNGYFATSPAPTVHQTDSSQTINIDDRGRWLFTDCPIRRTKFNTWEYSFTFTHNSRWIWNKPYNINQDKYPEKDFKELFDGMRNAPNQQNQGVSRT